MANNMDPQLISGPPSKEPHVPVRRKPIWSDDEQYLDILSRLSVLEAAIEALSEPQEPDCKEQHGRS